MIELEPPRLPISLGKRHLSVLISAEAMAELNSLSDLEDLLEIELIDAGVKLNKRKLKRPSKSLRTHIYENVF